MLDFYEMTIFYTAAKKWIFFNTDSKWLLLNKEDYVSLWTVCANV